MGLAALGPAQGQDKLAVAQPAGAGNVSCEAGHAPGGNCKFGPFGWRGVVQCKFCKQPPPDAAHSQAPQERSA